MDVSILANACRCCMNETEQMENLFDKFIDVGPKIDPDLTYSDAIYLCTNIELDVVANDDITVGFPQYICADCLHELRAALLFRAKCEETDALLRKHIDNSNIQPTQTNADEGQLENLIIEQIECEVGNTENSSGQPHQESQETNRSVIIKRYIVSYDSENMPIIAEDKANANETIRMADNAQHVEIEISDVEKSVSKDYRLMPNKRSLPTEKNWFECEFCKKGFPLQKTLDKHIEFAHSGRTLHLCNVCGQLCSNEASLRAHMLQHQDKQFKCDDCGKGYYSKKGLEGHRLRHQNKLPEKKYLCSNCGQGFTTNQRLTIHMFTHTGEKNHNCDVCNKAFATESRLRSHRRTHTGERPYECPMCGLTFAQSNALKCHKRIHTGEKPYKCKFCDKTFSQQTILKTHLTLHTGKTVKCPDCDKKFSRASYLILHRREHTGEKPYVCYRCPNRYKQKSHLDRHMDTHLGVKHKCPVCGKEYSKQWSLKMHMFSHSDKKPFECSECQLTFVRKDKYKAHLKIIHNAVLGD